MGEMIELAERCEKATGPDRDIDGWIAVLIEPDKQTIIDHEPGRFPRKPIYGPTRLIMEQIGGKDGADYLDAPHFTASIDAAMQLVPEGHGAMMCDPRDEQIKPWAKLFPPDRMKHLDTRSAATPALAICASSLRARDGGEGL